MKQEALFVAFLLTGQTIGLAQGRAFTYQGKLNNGTNPAAGRFDFIFAIFGSESGGAALATPITNAAVNVTNGYFASTLNFGESVFTGADRWLQVSVRTNGMATFDNLAPRQKITATPYAITAQNVAGPISTAQLSGVLPAGVFSGAVLFTNPSSAFSGNGAGLTNFQSTNGIGLANVVNVRDYGAVPSFGTVDCTLAISNAINAQQTLRWPLYFPACPPGKYYKISGSFVYDYLPWLTGMSIPAYDTGDRIKILGDRGAIIVQTADKPVFVFTNGVNWVDIEGLRLLNSAGAVNSSSAAIAFFSRLSDGQNSDDINLSQLEIEGFKYGLYSESGCEMHCDQVALLYNNWPFWLVSTNAAGISGTANNSILFTTCAFVENRNGGFIFGGNGVTFDSCEAGGPAQTNFVTINSSGGLNALFRGGNVELHHGAGILITGDFAASISIKEEQWGLRDFSGGSCWNIYSTNVGYGPRITIDAPVGGPPIYDCAVVHNISILHGAAKVIGVNPWSGAFTNYFGPAASAEMAPMGVNYNGPAPSPFSEGQFMLKYNYDYKGRTMLSFGAVSNWGVNQQVFNYPLLQYNYDLADGKIPPVGITTNINVLIGGNKTNQLQFTNGVLMRVVPQ